MGTTERLSLATRAMIAIARYGELYSLRSGFIADGLQTDVTVMRRILLQLKEARLIEMTMGNKKAQLAKAPSQITLLDVYRAVESDGENEPSVAFPSESVSRTLKQKFGEAQNAMERMLRKTTLAELLKETDAS